MIVIPVLETGLLTEEEALIALDELPMDDPEAAHLTAEQILCALLRFEGYDDIAAAFVEARNRCGWYYD